MNTSKIIKRTLGTSVSALALAAMLVATQPVSAGESPQLIVNYSDLNLSTESGAATLYSRIRTAAAQVCSVGESRQLSQVAAARHCQRRAIAQAVTGIHSALLSERHRVATGESAGLVAAAKN